MDDKKTKKESSSLIARVASGKSKKDKEKSQNNKKKKVEEPQQQDVISGPFQVTHQTGVTSEMEWRGADPLSLFRLGHKLGEGSFGTVFHIISKATAEVSFAAKHIKIDEDTDTKEVENEINILKRCRSPYIVTYYGLFRQDTLLWIIMDYCELGSVLDMMEKIDSNLTEKSAAWVLKSTLLGLQYLHSFGVVHRDVKAGNILVTREGDLKVADFGVSESLAETILGEIAGSPLWMAPEIIQRKTYNHKADIWSLGITAIELVDGDPPHSDCSAFRAMQLISKNDPPKLREKSSDEFQDFLSKMLVKDQEKRFEIVQLLDHPFIKKSKNTQFKKTVAKVLSAPPRRVTIKDYKVTLIPVSHLHAAIEKGVDNPDDGKEGSAFDTTIITKSTVKNEPSYGTTVYNTTVVKDSDAFSTTVINDSAFSTTVIKDDDAYSTTIVKNVQSMKPVRSTGTLMGKRSPEEAEKMNMKLIAQNSALRTQLETLLHLMKQQKNINLSKDLEEYMIQSESLLQSIQMQTQQMASTVTSPQFYSPPAPTRAQQPLVTETPKIQSDKPGPTPNPSTIQASPAVPMKKPGLILSQGLSFTKSVSDDYNAVRADSSSTNWALFGYEDDHQPNGCSTQIISIGTGTGALDEIKKHLKPNQRAYCYLRVQHNNVAKFIFITWVPSYCPIRKRGEISTHKGSFKREFPTISHELHVTDLDDLNDKVISNMIAR